jgi:branched-chain amino acid transport system substrate-binding protein
MLGRRAWIGLALAGLAATAGCSKKDDVKKEDPGAMVKPESGDILVGSYLSLSGEETQFGKDTQEGIDLATDEVNAAGGVKGRKIKVLYEDDKSNASEATQKVRQLIDRNKVVALLGEVASSRSLAGGLIANTSKVPMITPSSTNVKVTEGREYVFRVCFTDDAQGVAAAEFVAQKLNKKKVAILFAAQDPYSSGLAQSFRDTAKKLGLEIVIGQGLPEGGKELPDVPGSGHGDPKPDIIFAPIYYNDMVPIAQQAKEKNIPGTMFVGGDGWDSEDLIKGAGAEMEGAYFTNHYAPDVPWENSKKFVAAYKARFKREPVEPRGAGLRRGAAALRRHGARHRHRAQADPGRHRGDQGLPGGHRHHLHGRQPERGQTPRGGPDQGRRSSPTSPRPTRRSYAPMQVLNALLNGLAQGAMIALVALGYTMVYGILKLINFAHSEVFMVGAYAGFFALTLGLDGKPPLVAFPLALVAAMLASTATGAVVERIAYRPILSRGGGGKAVGSRITPLVTALGMSVLLQNLAVLVFDARPKSYPRIVPNTQIIIFVTALVVMGPAARPGEPHLAGQGDARPLDQRGGRAPHGDPHRPGHPLHLRPRLLLAALGAVLYCLDQSQAMPTMGQTIGTRAFVAAVLGGIGSIPGAVLGGLLLGVVGELTKLTSYSGGQDVLTFLVLIVVLLWRPRASSARAASRRSDHQPAPLGPRTPTRRSPPRQPGEPNQEGSGLVSSRVRRSAGTARAFKKNGGPSKMLSTNASDRRYWERHVRNYDLSMRLLGRPVPGMLALIKEAVSGAECVLEVAAGTGLVTPVLARAAREVISTDYAAAMVERLARRVTDEALHNVRCEQADIYALRFEPASFDAVVAANVLHLVPDFGGALASLRRVLKPGGHLIVPTFCHDETGLSWLVSRGLR